MAARRARVRRLVRWRNRLWHRLAAVPIGTLLGGAGMALCHFWPEKFPAFCALFAKLMQRGE